jgi:hypothetical protein
LGNYDELAHSLAMPAAAALNPMNLRRILSRQRCGRGIIVQELNRGEEIL